MECHICGTEVLPTHKYCMECGARLQPAPDAASGESADEGASAAELAAGGYASDTGAADTGASDTGAPDYGASDRSAQSSTTSASSTGATDGDGADTSAVTNAGTEASATRRGHPMFDPTTGQLLTVRPVADATGTDRDDDPADTVEAGAADPSTDSDATALLPATSDGDATPAATPAVPSDEYPPWPGPVAADPREQPTTVQRATVQGATGGYVAEPFADGGLSSLQHPPVAQPPTYEPTSQLPVPYVPWEGDTADEPAVARRTFRLKPLLILTVLAAVAVGVGVFSTMVTLRGGAQPGDYMVNDFGTNLAVAGILTAVFMVFGAVAWCAGFRWGAGLAGGGGAGLAGWALLPLSGAELHRSETGASELVLELGFWCVAGAGGLGLLILLASLLQAGDDGRAGLDPWVAALGAIAAVVATIGPLVPLNDSGVELNWSSPTGADFPALWFLARFAHLGLFLVCGVFGFLLVRRYGLGLAIGGAIASGWLTLTAATEQTERPIGPAFFNPGANLSVPDDLKPHVVTVAGIAMTMFFAIVATAMAIIDTE